MLRVSTRSRPPSAIMYMVRETKTAVNMLARMPIDRVTAKPFIGPVPKLKRKRAAISVVKLASRMVPNAREKPVSMAAQIG